jgi:uncharacterized protein YndB with AHSA1/START domain
MNILKIILSVIAGLIVLLLIVALFVKREYVIQKEISIKQPASAVFDYVSRLKNQDQYNKWVMADPNMKKSYSGTDGEVGFVYAWDGNDKAGKGEQEIKALSGNQQVVTEIRFEKPMQNVADVRYDIAAVGENESRLTWQMSGKNKYPMNFMNLFMGGILGKDMEESLLRLKNTLEKK